MKIVALSMILHLALEVSGSDCNDTWAVWNLEHELGALGIRYSQIKAIGYNGFKAAWFIKGLQK